MIYTVTFNPALDYVVRLEELQNGAINRTKKEAVFYGGKGINVSIILKNLGVKSIALGFVAGFTGKAIEDGVNQTGVETDFIHLNAGMSRINVKIKAEEETEINGQGPDIDDDALSQMFDKLSRLQDGDCLVLAGTIPAALPSDIYEKIMEELSDRKIDIVVDAAKDLLFNVLGYHPFLIKPNHYELGELFGVTITSDEEIEFYAGKLQELGARNVLVSMAEAGSLFLSENGDVYRMEAPKGEVINSVGAGDSMLAGFIASYCEEHSYIDALQLGTAAGSATAFSEDLASGEKIRRIYHDIKERKGCK